MNTVEETPTEIIEGSVPTFDYTDSIKTPESSVVSSVYYNSNTLECLVVMHEVDNYRHYVYEDVAFEDFVEFSTSASPGRTYNRFRLTHPRSINFGSPDEPLFLSEVSEAEDDTPDDDVSEEGNPDASEAHNYLVTFSILGHEFTLSSDAESMSDAVAEVEGATVTVEQVVREWTA